MTPKFHSRVLATTLALCCGALLAPTASAQSVHLRIADSLPVGHYFSEYATKGWMDEVKEKSNGDVSFEYFPAEQLGKAKDMLSLVQSGVADIVYVAPSYVSDKMPLSAVAELPGSYANSCEGTLAYLKLATGNGILAHEEYARNGVRLLYAVTLPPYQLFTGKRELVGIDDMRGLKVRTAGGAMDATARAFDAVPVRMAAPELYESLSRGTLDGMFFPYAAMISYDLGRITKYGTENENFGSAVLTYIISEKAWKKLSPEVQRIVDRASDAASRRACSMTTDDTARDIDKLKSMGVNFVRFGDKDHQIMRTQLAKIKQDWAHKLDERGKPGTKVLRAYEQAVADVK